MNKLLIIGVMLAINIIPSKKVFAESPYPVEWTRQLGTSSQDWCWSVAVDDTGNSYMAGYTNGSLNVSNAGSADAFLCKYSSSGSLLWKRQTGTSSEDSGQSVAVDRSGNVYMGGYTGGSLNALSAGGDDAFMHKYDTSGNLVWTNQIGTTSSDESRGIVVNSSGNIYMAGSTAGNMGGVNAGGYDVFVSKFNDSGDMIWAKQFGTSTTDYCTSSSLDAGGNVIVAGYTYGSLDGSNAENGDADTFVSKLDSSGNILWKKQIGTSNGDYCQSVASDHLGNVFVGGYTYDNTGNGDAFVSKLDSLGNILWEKQIGTSGYDVGYSITVDGLGNVFLGGYTTGNFGTSEGSYDAFVSKFDTLGNLLWTKQIGTTTVDAGFAISVDRFGNIYVGGITVGNFGGTNAGDFDVFLTKLTNPNPIPEPATLLLISIGGLAILRRRNLRISRDT